MQDFVDKGGADSADYLVKPCNGSLKLSGPEDVASKLDIGASGYMQGSDFTAVIPNRLSCRPRTLCLLI